MVFCQCTTLTEGSLETRLRLCLLANNEMYCEIVYHSLLYAYLQTAQGHLDYEDCLRPEPAQQLGVEYLTIVSNRTT